MQIPNRRSAAGHACIAMTIAAILMIGASVGVSLPKPSLEIHLNPAPANPVPTATPTPVPTVVELVFSDGFESGDTDGWTSVVAFLALGLIAGVALRRR